MITTTPAMTRINRIASHLPEAITVPQSVEERQELWADALLAAVRFYRMQLSHHDPATAERAARAILELEKTRLRHGRDLAGTTPERTDVELDPPEPETLARSVELDRMRECDGILHEVDAGRSVYDRVMPAHEHESAEAFTRSPEFEQVIRTFETLFREDRDATLPRREAELLAKEYHIRRLRKARLQVETNQQHE